MALTSKQEKFCQGIVSGLNQSDAYRQAYNCEGMQPDTVNKNAYVMMQDSQITTRVEALRLPIAERIGMGLESYLQRMLSLSDSSESDGDHSPAVKALENVGKALGYYVTKTEVTGSNGSPLIPESVNVLHHVDSASLEFIQKTLLEAAEKERNEKKSD